MTVWRVVLAAVGYTLLLALPAVVALACDPFPLARARRVEISVALGLVAVPLILLQFGLVSRIRRVSRAIGTDALLQMHQYAGLLGVLIVALHVVLLNAEGLPRTAWLPWSPGAVSRTGALALWAVVLIAITTVARRRLAFSYETWRIIHVVLALGAVVALLAHVLAVNGYSRTAPMRAVFAALTLLVVVLTLEYRVFRLLRLRQRPWAVTMNRDEGASIRTLAVRPVAHAGFRFEPGQFAWLITGSSPFSSQQHPLSIASSAVRAADGPLEFAIKAAGDWSSTTVPALAPGDRVWVDGPYGAFVPDTGSLRPLVLIAGGSGIAPMRGILHTLADLRSERHIVLIYAAHDESRMAYRDELEALRARLHMRLVCVLERPSDDWKGARGFVTSDLLRRTLGNEAPHARCFVCGPVPMMDAVERSLIRIGVPPGAITSERFQVV